MCVSTWGGGGGGGGACGGVGGGGGVYACARVQLCVGVYHRGEKDNKGRGERKNGGSMLLF